MTVARLGRSGKLIGIARFVKDGGSYVQKVCQTWAMAEASTPRKTAAQRKQEKAHSQARFLDILRVSCNVTEACKVAGISRRSAYVWREADPDFAAAWKHAEEEAADSLEQVAWKRATEGGSDRLMEILLKGHRPERYVEKFRGELTGAISIKIQGPAADL